MPRFVLLAHDYPALHLDLMFEVDGVLWAWRIESLSLDEQPMQARRNFDHRLLYLDYEGPISGDRGTVTRLDRGEYEWIEKLPDRVVVNVNGQVVAGRIELTHIREDEWKLVYGENPIPRNGEGE